MLLSFWLMGIAVIALPLVPAYASIGIAAPLLEAVGVDPATIRNEAQRIIDLRDEAGHEPVFGISRFIPVVGDDVIPEPPLKALAKGAGKQIDVLIGTNADEMNLYFVPSKVRDRIPGFLARWLLGRSHPDARGVMQAYGLGTKGKRPGAAMTEAMTDLVFRWPATLRCIVRVQSLECLTPVATNIKLCQSMQWLQIMAHAIA